MGITRLWPWINGANRDERKAKKAAQSLSTKEEGRNEQACNPDEMPVMRYSSMKRYIGKAGHAGANQESSCPAVHFLNVLSLFYPDFDCHRKAVLAFDSLADAQQYVDHRVQDSVIHHAGKIRDAWPDAKVVAIYNDPDACPKDKEEEEERRCIRREVTKWDHQVRRRHTGHMSSTWKSLNIVFPPAPAEASPDPSTPYFEHVATPQEVDTYIHALVAVPADDIFVWSADSDLVASMRLEDSRVMITPC
ncbi:hypothetical protein JCM5296_005712 [Sporobolomyces johnsonii]